jgi:TPR repeat protein
MFRDVEYKGVTVLRDELSIPDHFSTNPQAEVLCFSEIPLKYIDKVICKTYSEEQSLDGDSQELTVSQNRDYFGPRADYEIWKVIRRAEAGEPEFQTKLGSYYQKGNYVSNDLKEAASWYEKGARGGNAMAKNQLGYFYFQGEGVERNFELAAKLFLEAARAGSTVAQYNVGFCYEHGKGVDEDLSSARSWYQQAAEDGHQPAKDRLKEMEGNGTDFEDDLPF